MAVVIDRPAGGGNNQRQRWSHIFTIVYALVALFLALQLRAAAESATVIYADPEVGITVAYPQNWLIETGSDSVLLVRDMSAEGFKTSIEVQVLPTGVDITERNLIDNLILSRSQALASFDVLSRQATTLGEDQRPATAMEFTYVASEQNPFLESLPVVVEGIDVITTQGGQALIITFLSDASTFEANFPVFQRFLNDLDF